MAPHWKAELIRVSIFSKELVKLTQLDWQQLTGNEFPENEQRNAGRHLMTGTTALGQLALVTAGNRIDCHLTATPSPDINDDAPPLLGTWLPTFSAFSPIIKGWLELNPRPVARLALGAVIVAEAPDPANSYEIVFGQTKSLIPKQNMRDLMFRINWPRTSAVVPNLTLNRLTTWTAVQVHTQLIEANTGTILPSSSPRFFGRLEIDHNTDANRGEVLPSGSLHLVFDELAALANENVEAGEVQ